MITYINIFFCQSNLQIVTARSKIVTARNAILLLVRPRKVGVTARVLSKLV